MNTQLQRKIDSSISMLQKAEKTALRYQSYGFNVAFSGGKDSQVIVKLAELAGVKHRVVHNFTTMDAPANIRFIRENYPQCVIRKPKESFWQLCRRHKMLPTMMVRFCCSELKEKSDPNSVTITGVRRSESYRRSDRQEITLLTRRRHPDFVAGSWEEFESYQESVVTCLMGLDKLVVNPILNWSDGDVWEFIDSYKIPHNPLYKLESRVGCLFCPLKQTKLIHQDKLLYPKHYQAFLHLIADLKELRKARNEKDVWQLLSPEEIFDWWASKESYKKYFRQKELPLCFDCQKQ